MRTYLFLFSGLALAIVMLLFVFTFWLRFATEWSAGQEPGAIGYDEPIEHCGLPTPEMPIQSPSIMQNLK